jgi:hypothetical protein
MKQSELVIRSAFATLLAVGLATGGTNTLAAKGDMERCSR